MSSFLDRQDSILYGSPAGMTPNPTQARMSAFVHGPAGLGTAEFSHRSPRALCVSKVVFRAFALGIGLITLILNLVIMKKRSYANLAIYGPPLVVSLGWSTADMIRVWHRSSRLGIHPIAIVVVDLLLWISLSIASFASFFFSYHGNGITYESFNNYGHGPTIALANLLIVSHFGIFIPGCYETESRRRENHSTATVTVPMNQPLPPEYQPSAYAPSTYYPQSYYPSSVLREQQPGLPTVQESRAPTAVEIDTSVPISELDGKSAKLKKNSSDSGSLETSSNTEYDSKVRASHDKPES